ncbi:MAG: MCE family protein, partial [Desulfobacterales bacterium]
MNEQNNNESELNDVPEDIPEAVVQTRRQISIVWLVPVVAILIGGWLAYKAISEKGPTITITFSTAEGLEAGKTKIKYKNVEVGQVEAIELSKDLTHVEVTAELVKGAEDYLMENTRFWVVRARVAAGEVSGLGTLFSGAYIGMDPGKSGKPTRHFKGLEIPPVVT